MFGDNPLVVVLSQSPYVSLLKGKGYDNSFWKLLYNVDIDSFILKEEKTKTPCCKWKKKICDVLSKYARNLLTNIFLYAKHLEKFPSAFRGH